MPPTTFQQQYPLSSRKFWKKMLIRWGSSPYAYRRGLPLSLWLLLMAGACLYIGQSISGNSAMASTLSYVNLGATVLLVLFVLYLLGKAWYVSSYIRNYFYDVAPDAVTIRKGVFGPQEIHVLWNKVQDVYVDQDFLDRLFGLYDVHLATATVTSGLEAHIDGVSQETADGLKNYLLARIGPRVASAPTAAPTGI